MKSANEIKLRWRPYPEEKPKQARNCIVSVSSDGTEFTASSWWDSEEKQFENFLDSVITAWAYMPRPYEKDRKDESVNEAKLKWHLYPEEKPKKSSNCMLSISYFEKEFTTTSWWDSRKGRFEDFPNYLSDIITAWAYMPKPLKKKDRD